MKRFFYAMALATLALGSCSDDDEDYAVIAGSVSENVANLQGGVTLLSGVEVTLEGSGVRRTTVLTDGRGAYRFDHLKRGQYKLSYASPNYEQRDTTVNLFELQYYIIDMPMKFDLAGGEGEWKTTDGALTLTLKEGLFTLRRGAVRATGAYSVDSRGTTLSFSVMNDAGTSFVKVLEADYLGGGSLILFRQLEILPADVRDILGSATRIYFYKNR